MTSNTTTADLDLVKRIAHSVRRRVPEHVELHEIIALGNLGLCEAYNRYDPAHGVPFPAFASLRIRGAMLDGMRREDILSRSERRRLRDAPELEEASIRRVEFSEGETASLPDDGPCHEEQLAQRQRWDLVCSELPRLPQRQQRVIEMYFRDERPLREIGRALGVSESRAYQLLSLALEQLRATIARD